MNQNLHSIRQEYFTINISPNSTGSIHQDINGYVIDLTQCSLGYNELKIELDKKEPENKIIKIFNLFVYSLLNFFYFIMISTPFC